VRQYTVIYAEFVVQDARGAHECYHHLARITADDPRAAEDLCRANTRPGFDYQTLVMFEGHLMALDTGDHVMHHAYNASKITGDAQL